ncbi:alpha/beta hydrolase [Persicitalea jodogahamensis]|uniref:Lipase n=1 Tax=Persicitalea jodogahamensis TaxID=402147 RepID=A0A8J3D934_9BACT|nr:alpha/beta hydrolase [Persicitalea jodogahamensis]GHB78083.1 lipase [Persicitalea jodogahamensis]
MKIKITLLLLLGFATQTIAQKSLEVVYKKVDSTLLTITIDYPPDYQPGRSYPTILFFFGGGWNSGSIAQFEPHARYFASRGMVCARADYRVKARQKTTPFESVADAKSAMRFLRQHADQLGIDEGRLIAAGGSAGGHLAAALAHLPGLDDPKDDLSISTAPQALILYNPVIDNGPEGYGYERVGERYTAFSPIHNLDTVSPPTLFFLGTEDKLIPVSTAKAYKKKVEAKGGRCDLHLYEGQPHGFFNYKNLEYFKDTVLKTDAFLQSLGYLEGKETLTQFLSER